MRPDPRHEALRWTEQARRDLAAARYNAEGGHHNVACYLAQQAAEKALKAVLYAAGAETVLGHSASDLAKSAATEDASLAVIAAAATRLDRYYIPTRYPNGLPGGIPADAFGADDAAHAIDDAEAVVRACAAAVEDVPRPPE